MAVATTLAIAGLALAAAGSAAGVHSSRQARRDSIEAARDAEKEKKRLTKETLEKQAGLASRMRQRAMASTLATPGQGVATSASGLVAGPNVGTSTLTGM